MLRSGTYSVLFTDLRSSTALRVRVGDVAFDDLRRRHDAVLAQAIANANGVLVKSLGDGVLAVFAGAVEAIDAAVAMQQAIAVMNIKGAHALDLAVGIAAGDVAVEADDVHGTPVVEASRLCGVARPGEVLVADVVRLLAGSRGDHRYAPRGELSLKGLAEPVRACTVLWEPLRESDAPNTFCATDIALLARDGFVGRVEERDQIDVAWKRTRAGESACVLVAGEPGIGKTRFVGEFALRAHRDGAVVLFGGCDDEAGVAYQPWARALAAWIAATDAETVRGYTGPLGGELARLAPSIATRVADLGAPISSDPESDRLRLFEATVQLLAAMAADAPVVIVLDDLHWADKPSLLLLAHVVRSSATARVMIVGTYRDTDLDRTHALAGVLADLRRGATVVRIPLSGLEREDVEAFLRFASGQSLDADGVELARLVFAETDGNPFFLSEVVAHLVTTGAVVHDGERWVLARALRDVGLPEGIREMVGRRLSSLSPKANAALAVAAVVGARFDAATVAQAMNESTDAVLDALDEAVQARMVIESSTPGSYAFAHALVRQTLEAELTVGRRARWHRAIGLALEPRANTEDNVAELARHFAACAPLGEHERAVRYLREAAARARRDLAFEEAAVLYARALDACELGDDDPLVRCDLITARGEAMRCAGDPGARRLLFDAVDLAGDDGHRLAAIARAVNPARAMGTFHGVDDEVLALCERALVALGPNDHGDRARVLSLLAVELSLSADDQSAARSGAAGREAIAMARRLGDRRCLGDTLAGFIASRHGPDTFDEFAEVAHEQEQLADELHDEQLRVDALFNATWSAMEHGSIATGLDHCRELFAVGTRLRNGLARWQSRYVDIAVDINRLELSDVMARVERCASEALAEGVSPSMVEGIRFTQYAQWSRLTGTGELVDMLGGIEQIAATMPGVRGFRIIATEVALELGDRPRAAANFAQVRGRIEEWPRLFWWPSWVTQATTVAARLGDASVYEPGFRLLLPCRGRHNFIGPGFIDAVDVGLGAAAFAMGRHDEAAEYFGHVFDECDKLGQQLNLVRSRLIYADLLANQAERGAADRRTALDLVALARHQAVAAGAHGVVRWADSIERALG